MATDQEMLDRIAKLSTAIEQQKNIQAFSPRKTTFRPLPFNAPRGRGGNMSTRPNSYIAPHARPATTYVRPVTSYVRPAPYIRPGSYVRPAPYVRPTTPTSYTTPYTRPPHTPTPTTHNKTLVLNGSPRKNLIINYKGSTTTNNTMIESTDAATGRKQVAINGVDFVVKGKKLVRKDLFDSNKSKSNLLSTLSGPKVLVRRTIKRRDKNQNMVLGKAPTRIMKPKKIMRRSKGGNMVFTREPEGYVRQGIHGKSLILNTQAKKKPRYCGFFTRYGKCPNAGRCPFVHDVNRRAICPRFLQNRCQKVCKLSHSPSPYNMPHCVHFQKGLCKNDPCMYIHVRTSPDAPVCKAFAMEGYCQKGTECAEKHIHVCPEFAETGKCSNANCRLPHVARRTSAEKNSGIIRLGSWVSPQYFHAQKMAKLEKRKAIEEAAAAKVWTRPQEEEDDSKEISREREEEDGFVRLFDDSDEDDGWSQFERESEGGDIKSLRFKDDDESEEDESDDGESGEEEEEEEEGEEEGSDEEVYEEVSDDGMSDIEEPPLPP